MLPERRSGPLYSVPSAARETDVAWPNRASDVLFGSAPALRFGLFLPGSASELSELWTSQVFNQSNPKPGHTTGRSGRGSARRGDRAGRGFVALDVVGSIHLALQPKEDTVLNVSSEARTVYFVLETDRGTQ